jgi:hypothetical protein
MQVFTGHKETTPLRLVLKKNVPVNALFDSVNALFDCIKAQKLLEVEKLSETTTDIHA